MTLIFDENLAAGFVSIPRFSTSIVTKAGGYEIRNRNHAKVQHRFVYSKNNALIADIHAIKEHFMEVRGAHVAWLLKDWSDYSVTNEPIGVGDGSDTTFQAIRSYGTDDEYERTIKYLKAGTVTAIVDNVAATVTSHVNGLITLSAAPTLGQIVRATFQYYNLVRFEQDEIEIEVDGPSAVYGRISQLSAIEVLESDA